MEEAVLVIIKPDGFIKRLHGKIIDAFTATGADLVAAKIVTATLEQAEEHYRHIKGQPFYQQVIDYMLGKIHKQPKLMVLIFSGKGVIKKCRKIAGATSPEEADPTSIRGRYGRITTDGVFENLVHVSSDSSEAEREIKIWFTPDEVKADIYPSKVVTLPAQRKRDWTSKTSQKKANV